LQFTKDLIKETRIRKLSHPPIKKRIERLEKLKNKL